MKLSAVLFVNITQAFHGKGGVVDIYDVRFVGNNTAQAAGMPLPSYPAGRFPFHGIDDIFGLSYLAIDKACLHTGDGFLGQDAFGLLNLHYRSLAVSSQRALAEIRMPGAVMPAAKQPSAVT